VAKDSRAVPVDLRRGLDRDPGGGSNTGTGGGLAEAHIAHGYISLDKFIQLCKSSAACVTSPAEASYLDELAGGTRDERKNVTPRFKAEKDDPGFFVVGGVEQAFRTDRTVGSEVWFNLDKIYVTESAGVIKSLPMKDLFELVVRALAVHVPGGLSANLKAGLLSRLAGAPGQNLVEARSNVVHFAPKFGAVGYVERGAEGQLFNVAVSDFTSAFDQTATVLAELQNIFTSAGRRTAVIKKSRVLQASWKIPDYHFETISTTLVLRSLIETDAQDGTHMVYRCQMSYEATFDGAGEDNDRIYLLNPEESHWTVLCDQ
jgi:hypothetical protein